MSKQSISIKGEMELTNVIISLGDVVKGLEEGTICIQQGTDLVTLKPTANIEMELDATVKGNKEKISIELSWKQPELEKETLEQNFKITFTEPTSIENSPISE